ncbi:TonB-dependent siderophore receptor [Limnohabitans sp. Rim11]|uniref:TonB-dependent siderophore receptor n=1 Tax=Limnohabitans sp. Rim11 TaxID=1100719 RepID=UPI000A742972|nr:TonB-dependent siderophore receptor [Limnohabitans sp. Rim11]
MAHHLPKLTCHALLLASASAIAQNNTVLVTSPAAQQISGFENLSLREAPFSATNVDSATLRDLGAQRISDALRLDSSVTDSYNSPAYWDILSVRGFVLDNRYNYRREGLPINAETMIAMDNKERIELFKGTSGIQAGTSAPGGLANYVVKRPPNSLEASVRSLTLSYGNGNNSSVALDLGGRYGETNAVGYRFNAAYEDLNPYFQNAKGQRQLLALAMDWRINANTRLEWEVESSSRQQMGVNAASITGNTLPSPVYAKNNFSKQSWSVPGVFDGITGSVRLKQRLDNNWLWTTQIGAQRLKTDDRLSFAYGCYAELNFDRFCSDKTFDLYDYRSENERRTSDALQTELTGQVQLAGIQHELTFSWLRQRQIDELSPMQAYNWAGTGSLSGVSDSTAAPEPLELNTNRQEYSTEISVKDRIKVNRFADLWLGIRSSQIQRDSQRTDGSRATHDDRSFTTPWVAFSHKLPYSTTGYVSFGQGIEAQVTPNRSRYTNAGEALPSAKSNQKELGFKGAQSAWQWNAAVFDITRPVWGDQGACEEDNSCTRKLDGLAHHIGLELGMGYRSTQWKLDTSATWLNAKRADAVIDPNQNGQRPLNVPSLVVRAATEYRWTQVPSLRTSARISHEGQRDLMESGSMTLPAWTTLDLAAHYSTKLAGQDTDWTLALENANNRAYWRESPKQFGHYYLYAGAPRNLRITVRTLF